jgi:hypothetical protein
MARCTRSGSVFRRSAGATAVLSSLVATSVAMLTHLLGVPFRTCGRGPRRHLRVAAATIAVTVAAGTPALSAPASEYQVKAVFLFNFSQFVSWPPEAFSQPDAPLVIAVLGRDRFGADLDAAVSGERAGNRPLIVRRYHNVSEITDCQILFIDRSEAAKLQEIAAALRGRRILTVSDADDAAIRGIVVQFVTDNNRIRLRINVSAARADGLTISSKLLRPAQIVDSGGT